MSLKKLMQPFIDITEKEQPTDRESSHTHAAALDSSKSTYSVSVTAQCASCYPFAPYLCLTPFCAAPPPCCLSPQL